MNFKKRPCRLNRFKKTSCAIKPLRLRKYSNAISPEHAPNASQGTSAQEQIGFLADSGAAVYDTVNMIAGSRLPRYIYEHAVPAPAIFSLA